MLNIPHYADEMTSRLVHSGIAQKALNQASRLPNTVGGGKFWVEVESDGPKIIVTWPNLSHSVAVDAGEGSRLMNSLEPRQTSLIQQLIAQAKTHSQP